MEALHLTAHSLGGLRIATEDYSIGNGFTIQKGSTVALAHITSSLNGDIWQDPHTLNLDITANNPEQEQAEEVVAVEYQGDELEVGFNVSYLLDVLSVLDGEKIRLSLSDSASSALLEEAEEGDSLYVVMPMRL